MATVYTLQTSNSGLQPRLPRLSGFSILEHLYTGSYSAIYRARQDRLGRIVALKLLPEWPPPTDIALERFNRGAYAIAQAPHPNLITLFDTGTRDEFHYAALEFVAGQTLQHQLTQSPKVDERFAVEVGLRVARALVALHAKDICHRNVKPKNIFIENNGGVRLIGLGLASCQGAFYSPALDAHPIGTPHFMAPEMINGCYTDPRSDLYSLGITLFLMTAGSPPFDLGMPAVVLSRHLAEEPHALAETRPDLSPQFIGLVNKLLAKELVRRFQTAREVVSACEALAGPQSVSPVLPPAKSDPEVFARKKHIGVVRSVISGALAHPVGVGVISALAATLALLCASYFISFPWNTKAPAVAPQEQKEQPGVSAEAREFKRLLDSEDSRRNDPLAGMQAWSDFLRQYPQACASRAEYAHLKLEQYLKMMNNPTNAPQQADAANDF